MKLNVNPDQSKSKSLLESAKITWQRLNESDKTKYPTNTLTDYYDIIHKLLEALTSLEGIKFKGEGAHKELIDYVCYTHKLSELNRLFLQELRDSRNRVSYEGFNVRSSYIETNSRKIEEIIEKLISLLKL